MRRARNKFGPSFVVIRYGSGNGKKLETDDADEAYSFAYGVPMVYVEKFTETGSLEASAHFSPKHPLWSRGDFLKWARSRGRESTKRVREMITGARTTMRSQRG